MGDRKNSGEGAHGGPPDERRAAKSFAGLLREAVSGGTAFKSHASSPPGRAERLGLADTDPAARVAPTLPFRFLKLGDTQKIGAELAGRPDGLGALVVEFTAEDQVGGYNGSTGSWTDYPYHVAALQLGFELPWFAVAQRRVAQPSHVLYPGYRDQDPGTSDRKVNRSYALYCDSPAAAAIVRAARLRAWLPGALGLQIDGRQPVAIEVAGGWALTAIQARRLAVPDAVALDRQQRLGHPGPWPDALLAMLRDLRGVLTAVANGDGPV